MAAAALPDELISEILSPALKVSDEVFADTTRVSPFADPDSESTSAYLLVCKSWLRVATPLLYSVVVLRSKSQAKALGLAFSKNKSLAQFVKKLRVEGGFGAPLGTILKCSPNIADLFLTFRIWADDSTAGLCKGLSLISPTRLILQLDGKQTGNKTVANLEDSLLEAIPKWDRLTALELPGDVSNGRTRRVLNALGNCKKLERVVISSYNVLWVYSRLKACPLRVIRLKGQSSHSVWLRLDEEPQIKALVQFDSPVNVDPQPLVHCWDSFLNPMVSASPEVQESIWERVLSFAMLPSEPANLSRLPFLLVSKTFNRLALPCYYTHLRLKDTMSTCSLDVLLRQYPALTSRVRTLYGPLRDEENPFDDEDVDPVGNNRATTALLSVFSHATGLQREASIPWEAFEALASNSGKTLQRFTKSIETGRNISPSVFARLTALCVLDWACNTSFIDVPTETPSDGLPNLSMLQLTSQDPSFLSVLKQMNLPSLRTLRLGNYDSEMNDFLRVHGSKLTEVVILCDILDNLDINIFEVCPNLALITIPIDQEIFVRAKFHASGNLSNDTQSKALNPKHFSSKKTTGWFKPRFPNLREIQIDYCDWPTNERDINKSYWVRWADMLLKHNIDLTDKNGKKWRPRLKV
ncbi:hypothetical protein B0H16DRAFT_1421400 [Mycena metata]|uniref:Uncharacterized protein n=1 Tax=Mycena metata TaxID=1033252 RepID=A0AAD7N5R0_9AGAR|nr:hypothetical protein B0H16DRAFT_1421400 [Mycena metata]